MITHAESILHLAGAAAISAAMFGSGLLRPRGGRRPFWMLGGVVGFALTCYVADLELRGFRDDGRTLPMLLGALAGVCCGILALAVGLRGRRVGDHEYCRRCGFDLFGRPAGTRVCGECGAPLDARRAIVVGVHRRRALPMFVGLFFVALSLAVGWPAGREVARTLRDYDWRRQWPESWLLTELRSGSPPQRLDAMNELWRRSADGAASSTAVVAIIDHLLTTPIPLGFGRVGIDVSDAREIAAHAWAAGRIGDETMRRVMRASLSFRIDVAPRAARGHVLRHRVIAADYSAERDAAVRFSPRADTLDGRPLGPATRSTLDPPDANGTIAALGDALPLDAETPLGPATLTTRFTMTLTIAAPGRPTLVESRDLTLAGTTTIVDADAMRCPPATQPSQPAGVDPRVWANLCQGTATVERHRDGRFTLRLRGPDPLAAVDGIILADVWLRPPRGAEQLLGPVCIAKYDDAVLPLEGEPESPFELILRPRPDLGTELTYPIAIDPRELRVPAARIEVESVND